MGTSTPSVDPSLEGPAQAAVSDTPMVLQLLASGPQALSSAEAARRLVREGPNEVRAEQRSFRVFVYEQLKNGINLLLAAVGLVTFAVGNPINGVIILTLLILNVGLSILQE